MLQTACLYERAFDKYEEQESSFMADLRDDVPDYCDWINAKQIVDMLKLFYEMTLQISGSLYVTVIHFFLKFLTCILL